MRTTTIITGILLIIAPVVSLANYDDYLKNLESIWISKEITQNNQILYRNDVVRLLSTIQCEDCLHPSKEMITKYNASWWSNFITIPWNNFDDVIWNNYIWQKEDYYYCIAQAADRWVINWYPRDISPFCPWRFCGVNLVKQWELIQIIFNLKKNKPNATYNISRKTIETRLNNKSTQSIAAKNFTLSDRENLVRSIKECGGENCPVKSPEQFDLYAKYCTWNIWSCSMIDFQNIKEGQRPLAELNILLKEWVLNIVQADSIKPYEAAWSKQLLEYFYKIQQRNSCIFDTDYDKDGVSNHQDNCPVIRNPSQFNNDADKFGDVCDEDIDGDGIINPLWLVNDFWFINPSISISGNSVWYDNCPLTPNTEQDDINKNWIWDRCESIVWDGTALWIEIENNWVLLAPSKITLNAISSWADCGSWYFWNLWWWRIAQWKQVHEIFQGGMHEIGLIDCHDQIAYTTLFVHDSWSMLTQAKFALELRANPGNGPDGYVTSVEPILVGTCDSIVRTMDNNESASTTTQWTQSAKLKVQWKWSHSIQAFCMNNAGKLVQAAAKTNVHVDKSSSSQLSANNLTPPVGSAVKFTTKLKEASIKEISKIERDYGDNSTFKEKSLNTIHIYLDPWVKIVRQKITTTDGREMENIIQLYIVEKAKTNNINEDNKPSTTWDSSKIWDNKKDNWSPWESLNEWDNWFLANLKIKPYIWAIQEVFNFELVSKQSKRIKNILWNFWDWNSILSNWNTLKQNHFYKQPWTYQVSAFITLSNNEQASYGSQITVVAQDLCNSYNQAKTKDQNKLCDKDKDKIPDICDSDLDGDGILNDIGLVLFDNADCSLTGNNLNPQIIKNPSPQSDNCPIQSNGDQNNTDGDNYWDSCDKQPNTANTSPSPFADLDNDGIPNNEDTDNNDDDKDGTPNHLDNLPNIPFISNMSISAWSTLVRATESSILNNCSSCPCGTTQVLSPIAAWDIVYSQMMYDWWNIKSNLFPIK